MQSQSAASKSCAGLCRHSSSPASCRPTKKRGSCQRALSCPPCLSPGKGRGRSPFRCCPPPPGRVRTPQNRARKSGEVGGTEGPSAAPGGLILHVLSVNDILPFWRWQLVFLALADASSFISTRAWYINLQSVVRWWFRGGGRALAVLP